MWLADRPVALIVYAYSGSGTTPTSTTYYSVEADHLGTPRLITDSTQAKRWTWHDAPYGDTLPNEKPGTAAALVYNLRFPGQYFDKETNTHYNWHRDYESTTGRYIESDPIGLKGGPNSYSYVAGNPMVKIDPQGLAIWEVVDAFEAGMVGGVGAQYALYKLRSPCNSEGKRFTITVHAVGTSAGIGIKCRVCFTAPVKVPWGGAFDDHSAEADPGAFNGPYLSVGVGAHILGFAGGYSDVLLGRATSVGSIGASQGFGSTGAEVAGTIGTSTVTEVRIEDCKCEK